MKTIFARDRIMVTFLLIFILIAVPVLADINTGTNGVSEGQADNETPSENPVIDPDWGTQDAIWVRIPFADFTPRNSSCTYTYTGGQWGYVNKTGGTDCFFWAPLHIPDGALLQGVRLYLYDDNPTYDIAMFLTRFYSDGGTPQGQDINYVASSGTPGYSSIIFYPDITIDKQPNTYVLYIRFPHSVNDSSLRARSVRLWYRLQISPAPGTATFSDVPVGSFWHQYVEALADSGITTGFPDGTYRPNVNVTRGQMAAFLARALGLHWVTY